MNFITTELDDVLLLRWLAVTRPDVDKVVAWIDEAHRQRGGPLSYIAVVPVDSAPPESDGRRALMDGHQAIADLCTSMRVVILGSGMRQAIIRSISAGIMLASGLRGKGFEIDDAFESAVEAVASVTKPSASQIVEHAIEAGIIERGELRA